MDNNGFITVTVKMRTIKSFLAPKIYWALLHCFLTCFLALDSSDESLCMAKYPHSEYPFYTDFGFHPLIVLREDKRTNFIDIKYAMYSHHQ